jgi:glucose-6-phosphate-specific signal transduction histidine kinase
MSKRNILTGEDARQLSQAMEQIKLSLKGLYSITEKMIPDSLFNTNFEEYFTALCNEISEENSIRIQPAFTGEFQHLDDSHRIKTYLIVISLLNFLIENTKPTQIGLSFNCSENSITVHVSDNGRKYSLPVMTYPGIKESDKIRSQTESMNGILTILDNQKEGNKLRITFHG